MPWFIFYGAFCLEIVSEWTYEGVSAGDQPSHRLFILFVSEEAGGRSALDFAIGQLQKAVAHVKSLPKVLLKHILAKDPDDLASLVAVDTVQEAGVNRDSPLLKFRVAGANPGGQTGESTLLSCLSQLAFL